MLERTAHSHTHTHTPAIRSSFRRSIETINTARTIDVDLLNYKWNQIIWLSAQQWAVSGRCGKANERTIERKRNGIKNVQFFLISLRLAFFFSNLSVQVFFFSSLHRRFFKCGNAIFLQSTSNFFFAASAIRKLSWFNLVPSELLFSVSFFRDFPSSSVSTIFR